MGIHDDEEKRSSESSVPKFIQKLFQARGVHSAEEQAAFLTPRLKDLRDPFLMQDMEKTVTRLLEAKALGQRITIYGDFDLDGTSGAALLELGLKRLGFNDLGVVQPKRLTDGYGVHVHLIDKIAADGTKVIVTVDVGSTALEAAERCLQLGIDFIVTDHHLPSPLLPRAYALVNANSGRCKSGLTMLSGVGVAFYLVLALRKRIREQEGDGAVAGFDPKELLDCLVIGTLTDMTPLLNENRILMKHGLVQLAKTQRPALRKLIHTLLGDRPLNSQDVGFSIAPKLNALSRLETGLTPLEIFRCEDPLLAEELIETVLEMNDSRRSLQAEALAHARTQHEASGRTTHVWVWSEDYHKGVIGLVATQLAREFGVPAFVGSHQGDYVTGSGRLPEGSPLSLIDLFTAGKNVLIQSGGHREAAGFKVLAARAHELQEIWAAALAVEGATSSTPGGSFAEFETDLSELSDSKLLSYLDLLEPFGKSWPTPMVGLTAVVKERRELKGGHLKFTLTEGRTTVEALSFNPTQDLQSLIEGESVAFVVEPQKNVWNGRERLQLLIRRRVC